VTVARYTHWVSYSRGALALARFASLGFSFFLARCRIMGFSDGMARYSTVLVFWAMKGTLTSSGVLPFYGSLALSGFFCLNGALNGTGFLLDYGALAFAGFLSLTGALI
jgi:hypothetical protein